jgi:hypothetical protein
MSKAINQLKELYLLSNIALCDRDLNVPDYQTKTVYGLLECIKNYIDLKGGYASRINSGGVYDQKLETYRLGTTKRGFSDVQGVYNGLALYVEVKIGKDRQSEHQKDFQKSVTDAGGLYFIAKDFESFVYWWKTVVEKKGARHE